VQRRNSFECQCRSDIRSARYYAGGDGAARHPYHPAKQIPGRGNSRRQVRLFGRLVGQTPRWVVLKGSEGFSLSLGPQVLALDTAGRAEKSEIRNSKSEPNAKFETKKTPMNLPDSHK